MYEIASQFRTELFITEIFRFKQLECYSFLTPFSQRHILRFSQCPIIMNEQHSPLYTIITSWSAPWIMNWILTILDGTLIMVRILAQRKRWSCPMKKCPNELEKSITDIIISARSHAESIFRLILRIQGCFDSNSSTRTISISVCSYVIIVINISV